MATLTLIGEPFPDFENRAQAAAARCLTEAVAQTAPRGCSSRLIVARDSTPPTFTSARASVEAVPMATSSLPILWRTGFTARPLDGEFVHAGTPLVPLRARTEDDGSQTSVVIPHTLAWHAPELMDATQAKLFRAFAKRAAKLADVLLAPTHAVAEQLRQLFNVEVQVLPLAAPTEYLANTTSETTRAALELPEKYVCTTAMPGDSGRLGWLLDAMQADERLLPLVVLHFGTEPLPPVRGALESRVHIVEVEELSTVGAVISGAQLLALPQTQIGAGFEVLAALASRVPVLHAAIDAVEELTLEAGVSAATPTEFSNALANLADPANVEQLQRLRMFCEDRSRSYSWQSTAWQLWELHANL